MKKRPGMSHLKKYFSTVRNVSERSRGRSRFDAWPLSRRSEWNSRERTTTSESESKPEANRIRSRRGSFGNETLYYYTLEHFSTRQQKKVKHRIGPTVKRVWNVAIHVLHNLLAYAVTAYAVILAICMHQCIHCIRTYIVYIHCIRCIHTYNMY